MLTQLQRLQPHLLAGREWSHRWLAPLALLAARLLVAKAFFTSGWLKLGYVLNDQIDTLYFLFEDYMVPFLPVSVAAWMGMCGELAFSVLVALGLFSRLGALGLIAMSAVIYSVDGNQQAPYWAAIMAIIATRGAGAISLDAMLWKWLSKSNSQSG